MRQTTNPEREQVRFLCNIDAGNGLKFINIVVDSEGFNGNSKDPDAEFSSATAQPFDHKNSDGMNMASLEVALPRQDDVYRNGA